MVHMSVSSRLVLCMFACTFATPAADAGVRIVGASGAQYTTIQAAVNASVDGDIIFIKNGTYPATVAINDKALTLTIDPTSGFNDVNTGPIYVEHIAANKTVTLSFLTVTGGIELNSNAGEVRIQACRVTGGLEPSIFGNPKNGAAALTVNACSSVVITGSQLIGGKGENWFDFLEAAPHGGAGLSTSFAFGTGTISVYDSVIRGGEGGTGEIAGGAGGPGCLTSVAIYASNTQWVGGEGGDALPVNCDTNPASSHTGDGGTAFHALAPSPSRFVACTFTPGLPGTLLTVVCPGGTPPGAVGGSIVGAHQLLTVGKRAFNASKAVDAGQSALLQCVGLPGELVLLLVSGTSGSAAYLDAYTSTFAIGFPVLSPIALGVVPGSTLLQLTAPIPALPPGVLGVGVFLQPAFVQGSTAVFGSPAQMTILDPSVG